MIKLRVKSEDLITLSQIFFLNGYDEVKVEEYSYGVYYVSVAGDAELFKCSNCEFYDGVHNARGCAECTHYKSMVMSYDYCSRFKIYEKKEKNESEEY